MRMKKRTKKRSLLAHYLASNLSIAIFSCAILGMILFSFSIAKMDAAYREEQLSRLKLAADDLQRQEKIWKNNAVDIQFDEIYRTNWFKRDATYEMELVEALKKYTNTSPLIDDFFLLYRENGHVYYPGRKNYFHIHIQSLGIKEGTDDLYEKFLAVENQELIVHTDGSTFFCYNLPMTKSIFPGDAVLICYIDRDLLTERLETVMGQNAEEIYIYFLGHCISADDAPEYSSFQFEQGLFRQPDILGAQSENGQFTVASRAVSSESHELLDNFRIACLIILGIFTILMLLLACLTAYRNYSPIEKLMRRYVPNTKQGNNELEQINWLLMNSLESSAKDKEMLVKQMEELESQRLQIRRQLLLLLLSGNWDIPENETRENGCLPLPKPCFGLMAINLEKNQDANSICAMIEELSGEDMLFYATPLQDASFIVVLLNMEERAQFSLAADLIDGVREASGQEFCILSGETCDHVGDLARIMVHIFTVPNEEKNGNILNKIGSAGNLQEIIRSLVSDAEGIALEQLDKLLLELPKAYPSLMIRRYIYAGIFSTLQEAAWQSGMELGDQHAIPSLLTARELDLRKAVLNLAGEIYQQQEKQADAPGHIRDMIDQAVLNYIEHNLLNWNLNLDSVAEAVGVSSRQIARILQRCKNTNYKEYVTSMRMERAKIFLTEENLSVNETSQRVCYASVSYFIKAFRQYAGMTPANYKLLMKCTTSDEEEEG